MTAWKYFRVGDDRGEITETGWEGLEHTAGGSFSGFTMLGLEP